MAKEGYPFIFAFLIPSLICGVTLLWIPHPLVFGALGVFVFLTLFMLWFFRDPERVIPTDPKAVVAPADGKITRVIKVEPANPNSPTLVSIFMSPLDVHVNRAPINGTIREVTHTKGQFLNAMDDRASLLNEQNTITLTNGSLTIVMKQVAGFLARRCVFWKTPGETVVLGERVGLIKFSSRADLILPPEVEVTITPGERVYSGSTIIGRITS